MINYNSNVNHELGHSIKKFQSSKSNFTSYSTFSQESPRNKKDGDEKINVESPSSYQEEKASLLILILGPNDNDDDEKSLSNDFLMMNDNRMNFIKNYLNLYSLYTLTS